jgi:predicted nuclease with TOPRIM domain
LSRRDPKMDTHALASDKAASVYRSPLRVLARTFRNSRDQWKRKYQKLRTRITEFRSESRELRRSRDRWRAKAEALEQECNILRAEQQQQDQQFPPARSRPQQALIRLLR